MRTEIVVPFAFDTAPIEQKLQDDAYDTIMRDLKEGAWAEMVKAIPKSYGKPDWEMFIRRCAYEWLDEHADEVVEWAVLLIAAKAKDKRRWRDVLRELREVEQ